MALLGTYLGVPERWGEGDRVNAPKNKPKKDSVATTVYLPRSVLKEIRKEAIDRDMTMSALVLEAFQTRLRMVDKGEGPK